MNVDVVKNLVITFPHEKLDEAVEAFETSRENILSVAGEDEGEILSNLLVAQFVRHKMNAGMNLNEALREYGKRVKGLLSPAKKKS